MLEDHPIPWRELVESLYRRRKSVLIGVLLGAGVGLAYLAGAPSLYRATARIQLTAQPIPGPRQAAMSNAQIEAELALIRAPSLIASVLESGEWPSSPLEHSRKTTSWSNRTKLFIARLWPRNDLENDATSLAMRSEAIAKEIQTDRIESSNLVEVSYSAENPEAAAGFVNALLTSHLERIADLNERGSARPLLQEERKQALEKWQAAQAALADFKEGLEDNLMTRDEEDLGKVLANLRTQKVATETSVLELEARAQFLSNRLENHPRTIDAEWTVTEDESVQLLKERVFELEIERTEALSRYTPQSTIVRDLDRQIEESRRLLETKAGETLSETTTTLDPSFQALQVDLVETEASLTAAVARLEALDRQVDVYSARLKTIELTSGELARLENDVESALQLFRRFSEQEEQARVTALLGESGFVNVSIVEKASPPVKPIKRRAGLILTLFSLCGFLVGCTWGLLRDWTDPSVKSALQVQRLAGVRVLVELP